MFFGHRTLICKSKALHWSWLQCVNYKREKSLVDLTNWTNISHQKFWLFLSNNVVFPQFIPQKTSDEKIGDGISIAPSYPSIPHLYVNQYDLVFSGVDLRGHPLCVLDLRILLHSVLFDWSVTELRQEVQDSHRLPGIRVPGDGLWKVHGQSTGRHTPLIRINYEIYISQ